MPTQVPPVIGARSIAGTDTPTTDHDGFKHLVTENTAVTLTGTATGGWTAGRSALWFEVEAGTLSFVAGPGVTLRAASGDLAQDLASRFVVASYSKANVWTIEGCGPTFTAADRAQLDGLVIGTTVQAYGLNLQAIRNLVTTADRLPYFTGAGAAALATFTAAGRNLVDDANTTAQRATLGLVIGTDVAAPAATWTWRAVDIKTGAYTLVLGDAGKLLEMDGNADFTIPANSSVAFPIGTQIGLLLAEGHTGNIVDASGVVLNGETAGAASLPMTPHQIAVATKLATDRWNVSGV